MPLLVRHANPCPLSSCRPAQPDKADTARAGRQPKRPSDYRDGVAPIDFWAPNGTISSLQSIAERTAPGGGSPRAGSSPLTDSGSAHIHFSTDIWLAGLKVDGHTNLRSCVAGRSRVLHVQVVFSPS
jgi:hypothetical protein